MSEQPADKPAANSRMDWGDKEAVIALLSKKGAGHQLNRASRKLRGDKEVVLAAIKTAPEALEYAIPKLRADKEVVLAAVRRSSWALQFAHQDLRADREVVLAAASHDGYALCYASKELRADREVVLVAVGEDGKWAQFASEELRSDKEIMLAAIKSNGNSLCYASGELKANREVVLQAVRLGEFALRWASKELQADRAIVLEAVKTDGFALQYASPDLRTDEDFVVLCVRACPKPAAIQQLYEAREAPALARSWHAILEAKDSALAVPGQTDAPVLSVVLTTAVTDDDLARYHAEATLASGRGFSLDLDVGSGPEPVLNDLAEKLLEQTMNMLESDGVTHVFLTFLKGSSDWKPVAAWDGARPLRDFLSES